VLPKNKNKNKKETSTFFIQEILLINMCTYLLDGLKLLSISGWRLASPSGKQSSPILLISSRSLQEINIAKVFQV
jgi:hypothetical protein